MKRPPETAGRRGLGINFFTQVADHDDQTVTPHRPQSVEGVVEQRFAADVQHALGQLLGSLPMREPRPRQSPRQFASRWAPAVFSGDKASKAARQLWQRPRRSAFGVITFCTHAHADNGRPLHLAGVCQRGFELGRGWTRLLEAGLTASALQNVINP